MKKDDRVFKNLTAKESTNLLILLFKAAGLNPELIADGIFGDEAVKALKEHINKRYTNDSKEHCMYMAITYLMLTSDIKSNTKKDGGWSSKDIYLKISKILKEKTNPPRKEVNKIVRDRNK